MTIIYSITKIIFSIIISVNNRFFSAELIFSLNLFACFSITLHVLAPRANNT